MSDELTAQSDSTLLQCFRLSIDGLQQLFSELSDLQNKFLFRYVFYVRTATQYR